MNYSFVGPIVASFPQLLNLSKVADTKLAYFYEAADCCLNLHAGLIDDGLFSQKHNEKSGQKIYFVPENVSRFAINDGA